VLLVNLLSVQRKLLVVLVKQASFKNWKHPSNTRASFVLLVKDSSIHPMCAVSVALGNTTTKQDKLIAQSAPSVNSTQALATPIANHALQVDFSSTTKN